MSSRSATITPVEDPVPRGQHIKNKGKRPANLIIFSRPPPQKRKKAVKEKTFNRLYRFYIMQLQETHKIMAVPIISPCLRNSFLKKVHKSFRNLNKTLPSVSEGKSRIQPSPVNLYGSNATLF
jgi:hypothetical protein